MAKQKTQFLCGNCGSVHPKWMGKCPDCGTWDSLQEFKEPTPDARTAVATRASSHTGDLATAAEAVGLAEIDEADSPRTPTGIGEFDRILGGGIVPGSAVLVGGEPGIGKSTLLLQVASQLATDATHAGAQPSELHDRRAAPGRSPSQSRSVLYVTSEES